MALLDFIMFVIFSFITEVLEIDLGAILGI